MSKTRPYSVKVGAAAYMIAATDPDQARRIALSGYPSPTVDVKAANTGELMDWMMAGNVVHTKENFAPNIPATVVLYVDGFGQLVADSETKLEPGNYFLQIERISDELLQAAFPDANLAEGELACANTGTGAAPVSVADTVAAAAEEGGKPVVDDDGPIPADIPETTRITRTHVSGLMTPSFDGAFKNDKYHGDPADAAAVTHIWDRDAGGWQLQEPYASDEQRGEEFREAAADHTPADGLVAVEDAGGNAPVDEATTAQD